MSSTENHDFTSLEAPGTTPKINTIFDFSAEALGQLKLWLEQAGLAIGVQQIIGFSQYAAQSAVARVGAQETTASTSYVDLTTAGPTVSGLSSGKYLVMFGGRCKISAAGNSAIMSLSYNSAAASDNDYAATESTVFTTVTRVTTTTLSLPGENTIKVVYKVNPAGTGTFTESWITALRYANK